MRSLMRLRAALFATTAGACAGGLVLLALSGERVSEAAQFVGANIAPAIATPDAAWESGPDFALCQPTATARAPMTRGMIRLVATQTEVPQARSNAASPALTFADSDPPLWDGLGSLAYKITTASPAAQSYFDQGLRLTHAFNHEEAQRAFRKAQKLDPDCAMCFWGEALVLGPNINMPMVEEAVAPAFAAAQKARALAAKAGPHEQALIAALSTRYAENPKADRAELDAAYAAAMAKTAAQFPEDNEIAVLYAEALMDLSPWNYWQPGGREPNPQSAEIVPTLERVLAKDPNHPGAIHYYIHAVEASDRPGRAEPYADRLRGAVPGAGHLVHMPSHIYYRVGRYRGQHDRGGGGREVPDGERRADGGVSAGLLPAQCAFRHGLCVDGWRWSEQHRRGREAARHRPRRGGARDSGHAPRKGGALLCSCPVQLARRHPRPPRSGQLDSLREGDVALRPRRGLRGAA